jgi:hypothetical protein
VTVACGRAAPPQMTFWFGIHHPTSKSEISNHYRTIKIVHIWALGSFEDDFVKSISNNLPNQVGIIDFWQT